MRAIEKYVCEYCGTEFACPADAEHCENLHMQPQRVDYIYQKTRFNVSTSPSEVRLTFSDGTQIFYTKAGSIPPKKQ